MRYLNLTYLILPLALVSCTFSTYRDCRFYISQPIDINQALEDSCGEDYDDEPEVEDFECPNQR